MCLIREKAEFSFSLSHYFEVKIFLHSETDALDIFIDRTD